MVNILDSSTCSLTSSSGSSFFLDLFQRVLFFLTLILKHLVLVDWKTKDFIFIINFLIIIDVFCHANSSYINDLYRFLIWYVINNYIRDLFRSQDRRQNEDQKVNDIDEILGLRIN